VAALSGLGGDELFGGYPSFNDIPRLARWLPVWRRAPESIRRRVLHRLRGQNTRRRKLADILEHARNANEICALQRRVFSGAEANGLLSIDARNAIGPQPIHHPEFATISESLGKADLFETISAWELRTYMADVLLRDSDVMSMRHSLELRVPFVDRPLVEWLWQQPARFKHDRAQPKSALVAAVADLLPTEFATRRKRGFTLPFAQWMRADLRPFLEQTFSNESLKSSGLFARESVQRIWQRYLIGKDSRQWSRVWSLAVLIDFVNRRPASVRDAQPIPSFTIAASGSSPASDVAANVSPTSL